MNMKVLSWEDEEYVSQPLFRRESVLITPMRVRIHCTGSRKDGRVCNHVVAEVQVDEWEQQRALNTTIECKRCGSVTKLAAFM